MTAGTVKTNISEFCHVPGMEVVLLDGADDGETYVSKKFSTIIGAQATVNENDPARPVSVSFSGQTATLRSTGLSDQDVCLILFGRK